MQGSASLAHITIAATPQGEVGDITLFASHAGIGDQLTITGTGFGSQREASKVWFGELPQYTFSDDVVARPCTKEAASYVSWSDTQIVVTVPSMSPGLSGATGTYHPVYVEVGGTQTNPAAFYIDPVTVIDGSNTGAVATVFPNSAATVEQVTYNNSSGSQHSSYVTQLTLDATEGAYPQAGNYFASNSHDILIKDVAFVTTTTELAPSDAGVLTFGQIGAPGGLWPATSQYNITFHNCVIVNNMENNTGWSGSNGIKCYHGSADSGTFGNMVWSDCSIGTPDSPTGAFSRFSVELVENNAGFASYTDNYLHNIRFTGCDFEPMTLLPLSFACGGRGPDRGYLIDDCTIKGGGGFEIHLYGLVARDVEIWEPRDDAFRLEGDSSEFGGVTYIGPQSRLLFKRVNVDVTHHYSSRTLNYDSYLIGGDNFGGIVFDDCDFNMGDETRCFGSAARHNDHFDRCDNFDFSTSYIHGTTSTGDQPKTTGVGYWYPLSWDGPGDPATLYSGTNDRDVSYNMQWPQLGTRP